MNKTTTRTYDDLVTERKRLESLLVIQKKQVIDNWQAVKRELEPVNNILDTVGKFVNGDKSNPLLNMGLNFASDIFLRNFVLAKAGWLTRIAVPFVMKNYSSHLIAEKGKVLVDKILNFGNKFMPRKGKRSEQSRPFSEEGNTL